MAKIRGTTGVSATIAPASDTSKFPATSEQWHKGGFKSFANIAERDAMPPAYRKDGMHCYIVETNEYFRWSEAQNDWVRVILAQGGGTAGLENLATKVQLEYKLDKVQFESEKANFATKTEIANKLDRSELSELDLTQLKAQLKAEILAELQPQQSTGESDGTNEAN